MIVETEKKITDMLEYFLNNLSGAEWSETIVIVNHESSASEYADNQAALFIECYLQRKFNLLDS